MARARRFIPVRLRNIVRILYETTTEGKKKRVIEIYLSDAL
jgi:hypothetical protein